MPNCQNRMAQQHARAGEAHDHLDPGAHIRLVAMDRALGTGGFALLERAFLEPLKGIILQFLAFAAQTGLSAVLFLAVKQKHGR